MDKIIGFSEKCIIVLGNAQRKNISELEEGDNITIFTHQRSSKPCFEILTLESNSYIKIKFSDNSTIECGINQEFNIKDVGFVEAKDIEIGSILVGMDDDVEDEIIIDIETVSEKVNLYSIILDSRIINHIPYYIGEYKSYMVR